NTEFYRLASAGMFLNSSFGIGPEFALSGSRGPSIFPDTALGIRIAYKPNTNIVLRAAILDGAPVERPRGTPDLLSSKDGALVVLEAAFLGRPNSEPKPATMRSLIGRFSALPAEDEKLAIGAWRYTASFDDLSAVDASGAPVRRHGSQGAYLIGEKLIYSDPHSSGRATAFLQAGVGDYRVNQFGSYVGFGMAASGLVPLRPNDQFGLATAIAFDGSHYRTAQRALGAEAHRAEAAIELSYLAQLADWAAIQPDLQYVIHPATGPSLSNALVFQLRFEISI
ncbi:MAG: carbohydrate porin, partial [Alphaproteobacteria bacterium]